MHYVWADRAMKLYKTEEFDIDTYIDMCSLYM